jgi:uncharacterized protein DUF4230
MTFAFLRESRPPPATEVRVTHPGATVIKEIRALGRLETAALHVEKVVEVKDHQTKLYGAVEADDALLFVAAGEVVLGVDLAKLEDGDVSFDPVTRKAEVKLPPIEVLSTRFDEARSYVHARSTDVLAKRNEGLESTARREALTAFAAAGKEPRSVDLAKEHAEKQVRVLAKGWGATDLVVTWKAPRGEVDMAAK